MLFPPLKLEQASVSYGNPVSETSVKYKPCDRKSADSLRFICDPEEERTDGHTKDHKERQSWTVDEYMTQTKEEEKKDMVTKQKSCDSKLKRKRLNKQVVVKFGRGRVKCKNLKGANIK